MKQIIYDTVRFFHHQGRHDTVYLDRCRKPFEHIEELRAIAGGIATKSEIMSDDPWPSFELFVDFGTFRRDSFQVQFDSKIKISKLANLFHILHGFTVENRHVEPIKPTLDGFGSLAYIHNQFSLHEKVSELLVARGYTELDYLDMEEVVPDLSFPDGVTIFGRQVSVEYALFHDVVLGLCAREMGLIE